MITYYFILSVNLIAGAVFHNFPIATFNLNINSTKINVTIELDKSDLEQVIFKETNSPTNTTSISAYIKRHTEWSINNQTESLEVCSIALDNEHYQVFAELNTDRGPIKHLSIKNTCLIDHIVNQSNIIYLEKLDEELRGYRMHSGRTQISSNY